MLVPNPPHGENMSKEQGWRSQEMHESTYGTQWIDVGHLFRPPPTCLVNDHICILWVCDTSPLIGWVRQNISAILTKTSYCWHLCPNYTFRWLKKHEKRYLALSGRTFIRVHVQWFSKTFVCIVGLEKSNLCSIPPLSSSTSVIVTKNGIYEAEPPPIIWSGRPEYSFGILRKTVTFASICVLAYKAWSAVFWLRGDAFHSLLIFYLSATVIFSSRLNTKGHFVARLPRIYCHTHASWLLRHSSTHTGKYYIQLHIQGLAY